MPIIALASALAQFAPMIAGWLGGPKAEDVANKVVGVAQAVTGAKDGDSALNMIQTDPNLSFQFQKAVLDQQFELAKLAHDEVMAEIAAVQAEDAGVAATMQVEAKADHFPTYFWRPFIGIVFGACVGAVSGTVMASYIGVMFFQVDPKVLGYLPQMITAMATVLALPLPILGVASYFRGKMQADPRIPTDNRG